MIWSLRVTMPVLAAMLVGAAALGAVRAEDAAEALPEVCRVDCVSPYGEVLGTAPGGIPSYSNCSAGCFTREAHVQDGTFLGIKWQCVEFARRWLFATHGMVFDDVDTAADIWARVTELTRVATGERIPVTSHPNGSPILPRPDDLIVYCSSYLGLGHVAVVTAVDLEGGTVEVAEQNFQNRPWQSDHARRIDLVARDGRYWLLDSHLIGWKRVAAPGQ